MDLTGNLVHLTKMDEGDSFKKSSKWHGLIQIVSFCDTQKQTQLFKSGMLVKSHPVPAPQVNSTQKCFLLKATHFFSTK